MTASLGCLQSHCQKKLSALQVKATGRAGSREEDDEEEGGDGAEDEAEAKLQAEMGRLQVCPRYLCCSTCASLDSTSVSVSLQATWCDMIWHHVSVQYGPRFKQWQSCERRQVLCLALARALLKVAVSARGSCVDVLTAHSVKGVHS